jgi:hypothetical protein
MILRLNSINNERSHVFDSKSIVGYSIERLLFVKIYLVGGQEIKIENLLHGSKDEDNDWENYKGFLEDLKKCFE